MDAASDEMAALDTARFREATERWYILSCALTLTGNEGLQPFASPVGWMGPSSPPPAQAYSQAELEAEYKRNEPSLHALLDACVERAPSLCMPEVAVCLPLARLAAWTSADEWVRPLDEWRAPAEAASCEATLRSLAAHLLEKWDVPPALHGALSYHDGIPASEASHRISKAFLHVHADAGRGATSVLDGLRAAVAPSVTRTIAKNFVQQPAAADGDGSEGGAEGTDVADGDASAVVGRANPLHALRRAQVASVGGASWVADAACESRLGGALGSAASEEFALVMLEWVVRHQEALADPFTVRSLLDYFGEMRQLDPRYTCVGRTPKTVRAAFEAYVASSMPPAAADGAGGLPAEYDEAFQPNPRGLKGLFELDATIPSGTVVRVPYDDRYELGGEGQPGARRATVRIAEILSLSRLFYEGEQLSNCLEDSRRSQSKYLSRARARVSSFWSLTRQPAGADKAEHLCLIEVWHMRDSNIIRQAEGPHPRTLPDAEAWYWMDKWCKAEGIDLSTWDCYS